MFCQEKFGNPAKLYEQKISWATKSANLSPDSRKRFEISEAGSESSTFMAAG
jgi:hypothetical protein